MKEKTFRWILYVVLAVCVFLTLVHLIYIVFAYQHSSIIYFISRELW